MPRVTDRSTIQILLEADRPWSVYPLGDLSPGLFEKCDWFTAPGPEPAVVLLFRAFAVPVLFALGRAETVRPLLDEMGEEKELYLHIRPDVLALIRERCDVRGEKRMWRMLLDAERHCLSSAKADRLGPADVPALRRLYADGEATGEAPEFFAASMLEGGIFFGAWENGDLVAAAGTHLVEPAQGVAAIGNIYTRRDRRGRGLASRLTGAVAGELLRRQVRTVALNVHEHNAAAIRVYERLGFVRYCDFYEGLAVRR